jgi:hypothetical protein
MLGPCDPYLSVPRFMKALETGLPALSTTSGKTHGSLERLARDRLMMFNLPKLNHNYPRLRCHSLNREDDKYFEDR